MDPVEGVTNVGDNVLASGGAMSYGLFIALVVCVVIIIFLWREHRITGKFLRTELKESHDKKAEADSKLAEALTRLSTVVQLKIGGD